MAMFKYKQYNSIEAAHLVIESSKLAIYANAASFMGFPGAKILNWFNNIGGNLPANKYTIGPPSEWRELTPAELHLPNSSLDRKGYYTFNSPVLGQAPNGTGPQAKIFGKVENGKITKVALSIAGTNDLLDIADYFHLNNGKVVPPLEPLLNVVKNYALEHGLKASDVTVTGYSLGAALTNLVAKYSDSLSGGFYKDANFFAFASPYIYDDAKMILNVGYENDAVYRYLGNEATLKDSFNATGKWFSNPDKGFTSTMDNMILFDKHYASIFYNPNKASIFNKNYWSAHRRGLQSDAYERILKSKFYEYTDPDSKVVIDQLAWSRRWNTWVKDKSLTKSKGAFIFGNEHNNMLEGSSGNDYIDAAGGNDKIRVGGGFDRVDGGWGVDRLVLKGKLSDWSTYRLSDGSVIFHAKNKMGGIIQAENVEKVQFESEGFSNLRPYDINYNGLHENRYLIKWRNKDYGYNKHTEGTDGDDVMHGHGQVMFGKGGNDKLTANQWGSFLHGGTGHDTLKGGRGDDEIVGAEGNDIFIASGGRDYLYGGVGNDLFVFEHKIRTTTIIRDFNAYAGDQDRLLFSDEIFGSVREVIGSMRQLGNDVRLYKDGVSVVLENTHIHDFDNMNIGII